MIVHHFALLSVVYFTSIWLLRVNFSHGCSYFHFTSLCCELAVNSIISLSLQCEEIGRVGEMVIKLSGFLCPECKCHFHRDILPLEPHGKCTVHSHPNKDFFCVFS